MTSSTHDIVRADGRATDQLRPVQITRGWLDEAEGSVLVKFGRTRVLCAASFPRACRAGARAGRAGSPPSTRCCRARRTRAAKRDPGGRGKEIQRLIGRSLRAAVDLKRARRAHDRRRLRRAVGRRRHARRVDHRRVGRARARDRAARAARAQLPDTRALRPPVAAVSVGIVDGEVVLDLPYVEDSQGRRRHERRR